MADIDIIQELKKFIDNSISCAQDAEDILQQAVADQNYGKAIEMKAQKDMHMMFSFRLQRIVDGRPAFEQPKNKITG